MTPFIRRKMLEVRPLAGAGIEIIGGYDSETDDEVRPLAGAGIEIYYGGDHMKDQVCSPPRGGGN